MASKPWQGQLPCPLAEDKPLYLSLSESLLSLWPCCDLGPLPEKMEVPWGVRGLTSILSIIPYILHPISETEESLLLSKNNVAIKFPPPHTFLAPKSSPLPSSNKTGSRSPIHLPHAKGDLPRVALALDQADLDSRSDSVNYQLHDLEPIISTSQFPHLQSGNTSFYLRARMAMK